MFYVYLLKSCKDGRYYIGQTENIDRRLSEHNAGRETSTKSRRPFILIGFETFETRDESRWREFQLKKSAHQRKIFILNLLRSSSSAVASGPSGP